MKKIGFLFSLFLFSFSFLFADEAKVFQFPVDLSKPPNSLVQLRQKLTANPVIRAGFTQEKKIAVLRRPLKSQGMFLFSAEKGIYCDITKPFPSAMILTEGGLFQRKKGKIQEILSTSRNPGAKATLDSFRLIFSGDFDQIDRIFHLFFLEKEGTHTLGMRPKGTPLSKFIKEITISGEPDAIFSSFVLMEKNGDLTNITFRDLIHEPPVLTEIEKGYFTIEK